MKQKILAVCDLDETYAFRMAEFILEKMPALYMLHLFTETDKLQEFQEKQKISILLISEGAIRQLKGRLDIPDIFVLQESGKELESRKEEEYQYIDKYQSPEQIVREMIEKIAELKDWNDAGNGQGILQGMMPRLIGIYSPVRRCLQTSFALTMGQLLARNHRTLYLNFECYSGFSQMLHKEFSSDMMDVIYFFRCAREKLSLRLPSIVQNINGLDFIPPGQCGLDMQEITGENWLELLDVIGRASRYEYLILDLTDGMNGLFELLLHCYKIYTITKDDGFAMAKMDQYEKVLQLNALSDIADKTVKCRFPFFEKLPSDLSLMTHGELSAYVKTIIQEDLYEKQPE